MRAAPRSKGGVNESSLPPYFCVIFTPLSVRVSEDLRTAYKPLFGTLYSVLAESGLAEYGLVDSCFMFYQIPVYKDVV